MSKIELTIKADYVPSWGIWEGLREIMQNGLDAQDEYSAPLKVDRYKNTVRIENKNVTLEAKALLLGQTSKAGKDLRGQHGEGLDLGLLALTRAGRRVRIRSGAEVWTPFIDLSKQFKEKVLMVEIQGGRKNQNRVRVEIEDVSDEEWKDMQERFLFLQKLGNDDRIDTDHGALLLREEHRGRIYVKGIWVMDDPKLNYGYDYDKGGVSLDRDRRMISSWDREWQNSRIWREAASRRRDMFDSFVEMLEQDADDVTGFEGSAGDYLDSDLAQQVAAKFTEKHGEKAVPVETLEQSKDIEHLGRKGVIVPKGLGNVVKKTLGSLEKISEELRGEVLKKYGWHELEQDEKLVFEETVAMVEEANPLGDNEIFGRIDIVDFRSEGLLGQHKDERYLIAKKLLSDRDELLATLIHEVAHDSGMDGAKSHVAAIEAIWSNIVSKLRDLVEELA